MWTIGLDASVLDAIKELAGKDIGALVVGDGENPVGMFTERDYARKVFLKGKSSPATPVRGVMAKPVILVRSDHTVDECMALMTRKRVRHPPVLDDGDMVGMLSIGDRVKSVIDERQHTIEQLEHYIHC